MLKFELIQNYKHSIKILLRRKNLRFLRRTNHIQTRCTTLRKNELKLMKKTKWLIYTVIIGLIPFLIRSFICLIDNTSTLYYWLDETDFIVFGLVLNLSNINELEDKEMEDQLWKTKNIGYSIIQIIVFSAILAIVTYSNFKSNPDLNIITVKACSIILAIVSFIFSYSIFNRINKLGSYE